MDRMPHGGRSGERDVLAAIGIDEANRGGIVSLPVAAGDTIFEQGEAADAAYFVVSGEVHIVQDGDLIRQVGAGQCFGELAVMDRAPRTATARGGDSCAVLRVEAELFRTWHANHPELQDFLSTLRQAYQGAKGGLLTMHKSVLDGLPAVTSMRLRPDGETITATKVVGRDRLRITRLDSGQAPTRTVVHEDPELDVRVELQLSGSKVVGADVAGPFDRPGLLYRAVADAEFVDDDESARFRARGRIHPEEHELDVLDPYVCDCIKLRRSELIELVLEGARDPAAVAARTAAGQICTACVGRLAVTIDDAERMHCPVHVTAPGARRRVHLLDELDDVEAARDLPLPPVAKVGAQRIPILGVAPRLNAIVTDPIGMVLAAKEAFGPAITLPVPTKFNLVYVDHDLLEEILSLPAEVAGMGPVMANVPTVGFWFPRRELGDAESLQALLLAGRDATREILAAGEPDHGEIVRETALEHVARWHGEIDILDAAATLFSDASARAVLGRTLWDRIRETALPLYRSIAEGIDIPRATLSVTPWHYAMPEYKATVQLQRLLADVVEEHRRSGAHPLLDRLLACGPGGGELHPDDLAWMLMYVGWNATTYPGSYGSWALADILSSKAIYRKATRIRNPAARRALITDCFHETVRLWPVASLVRALSRDLVIDASSGRWRIPAGTVLGVLPWANYRDPEIFEEPETWNPMRYRKMERFPSLFGRGPFACVATGFNRTLFTTALDTLFQEVELEPVSDLPPRQCRVHLLYGKQPYRVDVKRC